MKTMKKLFSLLMALSMAAALSSVSMAAVPEIKYEGGEDPEKEFTIINEGEKVGESDLFANFKNVVPGDTLEQEIKLTNASDEFDYCVVKMKAVLHDETNNPVIDEVSSSDFWQGYEKMNEFLSLLNLEVYDIEGNSISSANAGELGALDDFVTLGRVYKGESETIKAVLTVPIEMDNTFASMIGEVDWIFHIEAFDVKNLTVTKVWSDGYDSHKEDEVTVNLLRDEEIFETIKLNAENNWTHTFTELDEDYKWTVEEEKVKGYRTSYIYDEIGTNVTIKNVTAPRPDPDPDPDNIKVTKKWEDNNLSHRPKEATIGLFDGERLVKEVKLNERNNWTHEFKNLDGEGDWIVREIDTPKGYAASYSVKGENVTVTNTETLVKTGQLSWPIPVLIIAGIALMAFGAYMIKRKNKQID